MKMRKKLNIKFRHCVETKIRIKILNPSTLNNKFESIAGIELN